MSVRNDLPIIYGTTADGVIKPVLVNTDGSLVNTGGGGLPSTVTVDNFPATQLVSGTVSINSPSAISVDSVGAIAVTNVVQLIIPRNLNRLEYLVCNTGVNNLFLDFVATVSSSNYSVIIPPGSTYIRFAPAYAGNIYLVAAAGAGSFATWKEFV